MALTARCRSGSGTVGGSGGGAETLSEQVSTIEDSRSSSNEAPIIVRGSVAVGNGSSNFEPLSDSCGESDMEGLDLSLFEPQVDGNSWCDSRIHAGTLYILVHYCGKVEIHVNHIHFTC